MNTEITMKNKTFIFLIIGITLIMCQSVFAINPTALAFLKSLAVPGWGELENGNKTGYIFIVSEVSLWTGHFLYKNESKLKEIAYYEYALKYAHICQGSYPEQYYDDLAHYNNSNVYNETIWDEARTKYPDDEEKQLEYYNNHKYTEDYIWDWDSRENRTQFGVLRTQATDYDDKAKVMIGGIILNHIISAINSARISYPDKSGRKSNPSLKVDFMDDLTPVLKAEYRF